MWKILNLATLAEQLALSVQVNVTLIQNDQLQ